MPNQQATAPHGSQPRVRFFNIYNTESALIFHQHDTQAEAQYHKNASCIGVLRVTVEGNKISTEVL